MSDYIPAELWPKVLQFLPVKSLVQCTSVCRTWRSLITSPSFISGHLSAARLRPSLLSRSPNPRSFSLVSDLDPSPISTPLRCPFPLYCPSVFFRVVGSVDGLVCLSDDLFTYSYTLIVWNPSVRRSIHLPKPEVNYDNIGPYHFALGFGFDSSTSDYKVVRVVYRQGWTAQDPAQLPPLVDVFPLREGSWRPVNADNVEYVTTVLDWSQCFTNGAVHWVGTKRNKGLENVVLLFDLRTEVFKKMKLPECLVGVCPLRMSVSVVGGLLAVLDRVEDRVKAGAYRPSKIDIWVKKGYGRGGAWAKVFTVDEKWDVGLALRLRRNGGREALLESGGGYHSNDLHLTTACNVYNFNTNPFSAFSYPESLVLLDKENGENVYQVSKDEDWIQSHPEDESSAYSLDPKREEAISRRFQMLSLHAIEDNRVK